MVMKQKMHRLSPTLHKATDEESTTQKSDAATKDPSWHSRPHQQDFETSGAGGGDTALALFNNPSDLHEPYTEDEERRLVWKIDFMILPYLAVCYAFFYIDKTTLSYAAIFDIEEDLNLHGTQYSWLSSVFYFGFLAWALPTNYMLQRFPVAKYLGINIFMWGFLLMCQAASKVCGRRIIAKARGMLRCRSF